MVTQIQLHKCKIKGIANTSKTLGQTMQMQKGNNSTKPNMSNND